MYSIFLPSSHPWHFIGLSPPPGLRKVLLTRISSLRCLRIKDAFSGAGEFEKVVSSYRWTLTGIAKYILIPRTPKRCDKRAEIYHTHILILYIISCLLEGHNDCIVQLSFFFLFSLFFINKLTNFRTKINIIKNNYQLFRFFPWSWHTSESLQKDRGSRRWRHAFSSYTNAN